MPCSPRRSESETGLVGLTDPPGEGPRLQDLVTGDSLQVTVHDGFDFWVADVDDDEQAVVRGLARARQRRGHARPPG